MITVETHFFSCTLNFAAYNPEPSLNRRVESILVMLYSLVEFLRVNKDLSEQEVDIIDWPIQNGCPVKRCWQNSRGIFFSQVFDHSEHCLSGVC